MLINNKEILLIGIPFLKQTTYINKNVNDQMLFTAVRIAQDVRLREVIGEKLLTTLCQMTESKVVTGQYKYLIENYIRNYLQWQTLAEVQIPLTNKIRIEGVIQTQGTEYQPITKSEMDYNRQYYDNLADQVRVEMVKWLDESGIVEWETTCMRDTNKFTTNIFLG